MLASAASEQSAKRVVLHVGYNRGGGGNFYMMKEDDMRLWPLALLNQLPRQQLLGQHRECCALRGLGWGKKHAKVDYVFKHPYDYLWKYHRIIMEAMNRRGFRVSPKWLDFSWRGEKLGYDYSDFTKETSQNQWKAYPEHNSSYLQECIDNLSSKGVSIDREKVQMWMVA